MELCARKLWDVNGMGLIIQIEENFTVAYIYLLASERSERDTLRSVQSRIADIYIIYYILYIVRANFVLITRKEGGA